MRVFPIIECTEQKGYSAASGCQAMSLDNASPMAVIELNNRGRIQSAVCTLALRKGDENATRYVRGLFQCRRLLP
jgi:hypothetical protein